MRLLSYFQSLLIGCGTALALLLGCAPVPEPATEQLDPSIAAPRGDHDEHARSAKVSERFPDIMLKTQHDKVVRLADLVRDRVVMINFMYTSCTGI